MKGNYKKDDMKGYKMIQKRYKIQNDTEWYKIQNDTKWYKMIQKIQDTKWYKKDDIKEMIWKGITKRWYEREL